MMKIRSFFLIAVLTLALAGVVQGSDDLPHKNHPITVGNYRLFLAAVAEAQDAHGLYQPDMEGQIIYTQEGDQKNIALLRIKRKSPWGT